MILSWLHHGALCFCNAKLHILCFLLFHFHSINLLDTQWNFGCFGFIKISPYFDGHQQEHCIICFYFLFQRDLASVHKSTLKAALLHTQIEPFETVRFSKHGSLTPKSKPLLCGPKLNDIPLYSGYTSLYQAGFSREATGYIYINIHTHISHIYIYTIVLYAIISYNMHIYFIYTNVYMCIYAIQLYSIKCIFTHYIFLYIHIIMYVHVCIKRF